MPEISQNMGGESDDPGQGDRHAASWFGCGRRRLRLGGLPMLVIDLLEQIAGRDHLILLMQMLNRFNLKARKCVEPVQIRLMRGARQAKIEPIQD
ncbi:hypothetical protein A3840_18130 [Devosia elaeis]|uniref:Uncharacterized protein n=1 Tax=Devosia elaeis TaxID=1770058 RepID=A0A178HKT8_9HYPH|nr:hypothetical protein A3840_18130 [Devosia elaeis]